VTSHVTTENKGTLKGHTLSYMNLSGMTKTLENHGKMMDWDVALMIIVDLEILNSFYKCFMRISVICDVTFLIMFLA